MNPRFSDVLTIFKEISAILRCSGQEKNIAAWLRKWAMDHRMKVESDPTGNVVIKVPATKGFENAPGIVLQGHMDMVCEKNPASSLDFSKDPIRLVHDGDWLKADNTTLGADNGIGMALCLSLAKDQSVAHPPLELLFTVEEETGLTGAESIQPGFLSGQILINIDSEDEGIFTVGSAGGRMLTIDYPVSSEPRPDSFKAYRLQIHGLRGGHSGVDIHKHRGNANKILAGALVAICNTAEIKLLSMKGGTRSNAIPRDAEAVIAFDPVRFPTLERIIGEYEQRVRHEYGESDPSVSVILSEVPPENNSGFGLIQKDFDATVKLLSDLPDGVVEMSPDIEGFVETSNNLATIELTEKALTILCFQRSSSMAKLDKLTSSMDTLSATAGATIRSGGDFPPWEPNTHSSLLVRCRQVYQNLFGMEPKVSAIHAGLECSIIGSKYPGLDMISLGPTIENPHSPDERLYIPSVQKVRDFLVALLRSYQFL
jgi:dipeptidase D